MKTNVFLLMNAKWKRTNFFCLFPIGNYQEIQPAG